MPPQELAYHTHALLVQWKDALRGLHSVLVRGAINEDTIALAMAEARSIAVYKTAPRELDMADDSLETHAERTARWNRKKLTLWKHILPRGECQHAS